MLICVLREDAKSLLSAAHPLTQAFFTCREEGLCDLCVCLLFFFFVFFGEPFGIHLQPMLNELCLMDGTVVFHPCFELCVFRDNPCFLIHPFPHVVCQGIESCIRSEPCKDCECMGVQEFCEFEFQFC